MAGNARFYRPELDALRFLAFFLVFLRHTGSSISDEMTSEGGVTALIANASTAGSYGVDLFFLLSAYLITEILMREKALTGSVNVTSFYARRILRIWPLYFTFILATLALSKFTPVQFPQGAVIPMLLFYGNWYLMTHNFFSPAGVLWSVSIEEQFYVLCPFVVRSFSRHGLLLVAVFLIIVANITRVSLLLTGTKNPAILWYCTVTRLDPIAIGIAVCLILHGRMPIIPPLLRGVLVISGLTCFYAAATVFQGLGDLTPVRGGLAYPIADLGALAVFLGFLGAKITWQPLVYLGQISYGLYVYHLLALDLAKVGILHFMGECPFWLRGAVALPITIMLAAISYAWLEQPFLRLKGTTSRSGPSAPAVPSETR